MPVDSIITDSVNNFTVRENCIAGICDVAPLSLDTTGFTPFVSRNHLKRTDPAANLPGAKSIIVIGVESKIVNFPPMPEDAGSLSVLGVADDYHIVVKTLLTKLVTELRIHINFKYKILVDSPTLDERALAVRAGLGFFGRNGLVFSPEYGSRFNIGLLLTDINIANLCNSQDIEYIPQADDDEKSHACDNCNNCINACPTGALSESAGLDASRCISYLTQKENLTAEEAVLMGRHLYGCDICQNVCPMNGRQPTAWANPEDWLSMTDTDFANTYGHTAMLWRGVALLKRNAKYLCATPSPKLLP